MTKTIALVGILFLKVFLMWLQKNNPLNLIYRGVPSDLFLYWEKVDVVECRGTGLSKMSFHWSFRSSALRPSSCFEQFHFRAENHSRLRRCLSQRIWLKFSSGLMLADLTLESESFLQKTELFSAWKHLLLRLTAHSMGLLISYAALYSSYLRDNPLKIVVYFIF